MIRQILSRSLLLLLLLLLAAIAGAQEIVFTWRPPGGFNDCANECGGWNVDPATSGVNPQTRSCPFVDPLPQGARVHSISVSRPIASSKFYAWQGTPSVSMAMNSTALGGWQVIGNYSNGCTSTATYTFASEHYPNGMPGYNYGGSNTLSTTAMSGNISTMGPVITFRYTLAVDVVAVSGAPQTGVIAHPLEQQLVARLKGPAGFDVSNRDVTFKITGKPGNAVGAGVGASETTATAATYTVKTDSTGTARASVNLGDREGNYTIEASTPVSTSGAPATFVVTGKKPASIRIVENAPDPALAKAAYLVSILTQPKFYAVGLDANGQRLGKVRSTWSVSASGGGAGAATVNPTTQSSDTTFSPSAVGVLKLSAAPTLSGVTTAKVDVLVSGVFIDVDNNLSLANVHDDLPRFVPGSTLGGIELPVPSNPATEIQVVKVHVLNGGNTRGEVTFTLNDVSSYPGIAMNWPITDPQSGFDLDFGPEADSGCALRQCITVPLSATGNTSAKLYVRDYGARGKLVARITLGTTVYIQEVRLPKDDDLNLLPDGGWYANSLVDTTGLSAIYDSDSLPAGPAGDGLSNYEEYRGFVIASTHVRTDPRRRDIFVVADPDLMTGVVTLQHATTTLPFSVFYLDLGQVAGEDWPSRGITKGKPIVNPNRLTVPGAQNAGQRAVRVVLQKQSYPYTRVEVEPGVIQYIETWRTGIFGATILDWIDPNFIDQRPDGTPVHSFAAETPNSTRWAEVYDKSFENGGLATAFDNLLHMDRNGEPVPPCPEDGNIPGCDEYRYDLNLILPRIYPGGWYELHSVPDPGDWYSKRVVTCEAMGTLEPWGFAPGAMTAGRAVTGAHELGHGIGINHTTTCGELMFTAEILGISRGVFDIHPLPIYYSSGEASQVKLH